VSLWRDSISTISTPRVQNYVMIKVILPCLRGINGKISTFITLFVIICPTHLVRVIVSNGLLYTSVWHGIFIFSFSPFSPSGSRSPSTNHFWYIVFFRTQCWPFVQIFKILFTNDKGRLASLTCHTVHQTY